MDNVYEQLVTINKSTGQKIAYIVLIFLIFVMGLFIFLFTAPFISLLLGLVAGGGAIFLGLFLLSNSVFEFEYTFTNGELDIDKIVAKRKRKRLITVEIKNITGFGKYKDIKEKTPTGTTIIGAHDGTSEDTYYADFRSQKYGATRLYFSPDEKTLNNINKYLPRNLRTH